MIRQPLNDGWLFVGTLSSVFRRGPEEWLPVSLPHDYIIGQERKADAPSGAAMAFFPTHGARYKRTLHAPQVWVGKTVLVEFEGIYHNADILLNGNLLAKQPYGYTTFQVDLTPALNYGADNELKVVVGSAQDSSRWYTGGGIYRPASLLVADATHITPWGVTVTTPVVDPATSTVAVRTEIQNNGAAHQSFRLRSTVVDPLGAPVARHEVPLTVRAHSTLEFPQTMTVTPALLWSCDTPHLYQVVSELLSGTEVIDTAATSFGIRSITVDAAHGFRLNGTPLKLKGGCFHHDNGLLGACAFPRAEERRVELHKAAGFNALRSSHNPTSVAMLEACDRLGMLLIDETFDTWRIGKRANDYGLFFEDWWQHDTAAMVKRDRNHPSVIMYSIGNEITERDGGSEGALWSLRQAEFVRSLDPHRPVTSAICGVMPNPGEFAGLMANLAPEVTANIASAINEVMSRYEKWAPLTEAYAAPLDVVGYNYMDTRYDQDSRQFPHRVICGLESHPRKIGSIWANLLKQPQVLGDFTWASWDYLGESGVGHHFYNGEAGFFGDFPYHTANCADFDICGFRRPQSYYREIVWQGRTKPYIAVLKPQWYGRQFEDSEWAFDDAVESWDWPGFEGKPVQVAVYSASAEVELVQDGRSLGRKSAGPGANYRAVFETVWGPGRLEAVAWNGTDRLGTMELVSPGRPAALSVEADRPGVTAGGLDLVYVTVAVVDAQGRRVPSAQVPTTVGVTGPATLAGMGTGDPKTTEGFTGPTATTYHGRVQVILRAGTSAGEATVEVSAPGLGTTALTVKVG